MVDAVSAGTGTAAQISGVEVAGKTGTAETGVAGRQHDVVRRLRSCGERSDRGRRRAREPDRDGRLDGGAHRAGDHDNRAEPERLSLTCSRGLFRHPARRGLRRPLPRRAEARHRRDGHGLPRRGPGARPPRRDQDPRRPPRTGRAVRRALPTRGEERRCALPPEHRRRLRPRPLQRDVLHRHGVPRGQDASRSCSSRGGDAGPRRRRLRAADPRGARVRAPERHRPPRHQAAQHHRRARRPDQGHGLRHRPLRVEPGHRGRLDHRHRPVPVPRAGARPPGGPSGRPLFHRDRALRDAHGQRPVHRRHAARGGDAAPLGGARAALGEAAGDPARARRDRPAGAREGPWAAVRERARHGRRPRALRAGPVRLAGHRGGGHLGAGRRRRCRGCHDRPPRLRGADDVQAVDRPLLRLRPRRAAPAVLALAARRACSSSPPASPRTTSTTGSPTRSQAPTSSPCPSWKGKLQRLP